MGHADDVADFEQSGRFKGIRDGLRRIGPVSPPPGFTAGVMGKLLMTAAGAGPADRAQGRRSRLSILRTGWMVPADLAECVLCYVLAGVFYLVLGIVLTFGLNTILGRMPDAGWVMFQPGLAIFLSIGFISLGVLLSRSNRRAAKAACYVIFAYVGTFILNSVALYITLGDALSLSGLVMLLAGGTSLGFFLVIITQGYLASTEQAEA